jgi:hypothetical protein
VHTLDNSVLLQQRRASEAYVAAQQRRRSGESTSVGGVARGGGVPQPSLWQMSVSPTDNLVNTPMMRRYVLLFCQTCLC